MTHKNLLIATTALVSMFAISGTASANSAKKVTLKVSPVSKNAKTISGKATAGAKVTVRHNKTTVAAGKTAKNGHFKINIKKSVKLHKGWSYKITATKKGYAKKVVTKKNFLDKLVKKSTKKSGNTVTVVTPSTPTTPAQPTTPTTPVKPTTPVTPTTPASNPYIDLGKKAINDRLAKLQADQTDNNAAIKEVKDTYTFLRSYNAENDAAAVATANKTLATANKALTSTKKLSDDADYALLQAKITSETPTETIEYLKNKADEAAANEKQAETDVATATTKLAAATKQQADNAAKSKDLYTRGLAVEGKDLSDKALKAELAPLNKKANEITGQILLINAALMFLK